MVEALDDLNAIGARLAANARSLNDAIWKADVAAKAIKIAVLRAYADRASGVELVTITRELNEGIATLPLTVRGS